MSVKLLVQSGRGQCPREHLCLSKGEQDDWKKGYPQCPRFQHSLPTTGPLFKDLSLYCHPPCLSANPAFWLATSPQGQYEFLLHCVQPIGYTFSSEPQLVNCGVWAKSSLLSIFANKVLSGHNYDHLFMYFLWLLKATINWVVTTKIYDPQS